MANEQRSADGHTDVERAAINQRVDEGLREVADYFNKQAAAQLMYETLIAARNDKSLSYMTLMDVNHAIHKAEGAYSFGNTSRLNADGGLK